MGYLQSVVSVSNPLTSDELRDAYELPTAFSDADLYGRNEMPAAAPSQSSDLLGGYIWPEFLASASSSTVTLSRSASNSANINAIQILTSGYIKKNSSMTSTTCNSTIRQWATSGIYDERAQISVRATKTGGSRSVYGSALDSWLTLTSQPKFYITGNPSTWSTYDAYIKLEFKHIYTNEIIFELNYRLKNT